MSAFVVGKVHIDAMITAALDVDDRGLYWYTPAGGGRKVDSDNADELGAMLVRTNVESVRARYPGDGYDDMPGPVENGFAIAAAVSGTYNFERTQSHEPGEIMAAVSCYEYQSCEHDGWEGSEAQAFCRYLREALCRQVPGYEGTWELTERGNPWVKVFGGAR